jgi:branched-chain amino acid transport system substrate-binding protein
VTTSSTNRKPGRQRVPGPAAAAASIGRPEVARAGVLLAFTLGALLLSACRDSDASVRIAAAGNWREFHGAMNKRGIDLAVEELNAAGGVRGRPMQLVALDDSSDGTRAVTVASEFFNDATILGVVGHIESGPMVAAAKIYDQGLPAIATTATSPDLSGMSPWVFRVISSDSVNGRDIAAYARRLGLRRAAIIYENNSYGRGLADAFERHFGGEIIGSDPIASDSTADFEPHVSWLKARRPDVVFVAGTASPGIALLREARRQALTATFIGGDGWSGVAASPAAEGVVVATPFSSLDPRPEVRRFVQAFRARYQMEPDANAALAYDATRLLAEAIEKGGPTRLAIRDWLTRRASESAYQGVTGPIQFTAGGDIVGKPFVMTRIRAGALMVDPNGGA